MSSCVSIIPRFVFSRSGGQFKNRSLIGREVMFLNPIYILRIFTFGLSYVILLAPARLNRLTARDRWHIPCSDSWMTLSQTRLPDYLIICSCLSLSSIITLKENPPQTKEPELEPFLISILSIYICRDCGIPSPLIGSCALCCCAWRKVARQSLSESRPVVTECSQRGRKTAQ